MKMGTYGLGTSVRGPTSIGAGGLAGQGQQQQQGAMQALGSAAEQETSRGIANQQLEQQEKQGNVALGTSVGTIGGMAIGAKMGSVGGPMGAAIGAVVGALAASLF